MLYMLLLRNNGMSYTHIYVYILNTAAIGQSNPLKVNVLVWLSQ